MSYNLENLARIRREYDNKHCLAEQAADEKRLFLQTQIPGLAEIDRKIAQTGPRLFAIALHKSTETTAEVRAEVQALRAQRGELLRSHGYPEDYSDVHYSCPDCSDSGYADGKMCHCMKQALVLAGYESSGIANLMQDCRFDNFSLDYYKTSQAVYENMSRVLQIVRSYAENFTVGSPNLLFLGETGLGKTHLSVAVAKTLIERGYDVVYSGAVGLFSDFEAARFHNTVGTESGNPTERYFTCDLLVIDDLGTEVSNQFTVSCLFDLINRRRNLGLPTVINTNLNYNELGARYTDRIVSRLFGEFLPLQFSGKDVRLQKLTQSRTQYEQRQGNQNQDLHRRSGPHRGHYDARPQENLHGGAQDRRNHFY